MLEKRLLFFLNWAALFNCVAGELCTILRGHQEAPGWCSVSAIMLCSGFPGCLSPRAPHHPLAPGVLVIPSYPALLL